MFSVLVKKPDGSENLYACDEINKEDSVIILRGDHLGYSDSRGMLILGPGGQTMAFEYLDTLRSLTPPRHSEDPQTAAADIYVMNSSGRTVTSYRM